MPQPTVANGPRALFLSLSFSMCRSSLAGPEGRRRSAKSFRKFAKEKEEELPAVERGDEYAKVARPSTDELASSTSATTELDTLEAKEADSELHAADEAGLPFLCKGVCC